MVHRLLRCVKLTDDPTMLPVQSVAFIVKAFDNITVHVCSFAGQLI